MSEPSESATRSSVEDATCIACGCLCDDLTIVAERGQIIEAQRACEIGRRWFFADHGSSNVTLATRDGEPADSGQAIGRAAEILGNARSPVLIGLERTTSETVAEALAIADRIGAVVDPGMAEGRQSRSLAVQRLGRVSATLGEVKNRADVVVFWGVDPVVTHPRHLERYSADPVGRFVPQGRAGRTLIVADAGPTATAHGADVFLQVAPEAQFATLWTLRALVRGVALDPERVARATGSDLAVIANLADRLKGARYGAMFFGASLREPAEVEAALGLVRDLNAVTRFVILPLGEPGNATGAEAVLTWQSGFPMSVSWARGFPQSLPGATSVDAFLARRAADAALIIGSAEETGLSEPAHAHLASIPRVVIGPRATTSGISAAVALASATPGIDATGTMMRVDGVVLSLRPALAPRLPTDRQWLRAIHDRLTHS
jgi:formylmethanofuran dehydrogenase subunit B